MENATKLTAIEQFVIEKVKQFRLKAGFSQAELAFRLGVSLSFIGNAENPKYPTKYNINHLNKFAEIFNCSPKDFLPETKL
jgi:transcriptional regulator with XRE-family HTH domain